LSKIKIILAVFAFLFFELSLAQSIVINEAMPKNFDAIIDEDSETPDWIEIYNSSGNEINLGGYYLSDDIDNLSMWEFPSGAMSAYEHLIVFASDKDRYIWPGGSWHPIINFGATWNYKNGSADIPSDWNLVGFDDGSWLAGYSGIGFGDQDDMTEIEPTLSVYMRNSFSLGDLSEVRAGMLHIDYDDAFVAYINGHEIARSNIGDEQEIPFDQPAEINLEASVYQGGIPEKFLIENIINFLVQGENILAIQVHNSSEFSDDLSALPMLSLLYDNNPSSGSNTSITIEILTDSYPEETSWTIQNSDGSFQESIDAGSLGQPNQLYSWTFDLPQDDYIFEINDTWGDGICCEDGVPVELLNGDFESEGYWATYPGDMTTDNWNRLPDTGHNSSYAIELMGITSTGNSVFWQRVPATTGEEYYLEAYVKISSENSLAIGQSANIVLEFWNSQWTQLQAFQSANLNWNSDEDVWHKLTASGTAPFGTGNIHAVLVFNNPFGSDNGSAFFDDVVLRQNIHETNTDNYVPGGLIIRLNQNQIFDGGDFTSSKNIQFNSEFIFSNLLDYKENNLHTNFKIKSEGETVYLSNPNLQIVDSLVTLGLDGNISIGYQEDGGNDLVLFDQSTPGSSNNDSEGYYGYTDDPVFSEPAGFYENDFALIIDTGTQDATIYYTLDGSIPDYESEVYNGPIIINNELIVNSAVTVNDYDSNSPFEPQYNGIVVRAFAKLDGFMKSNIESNSYIFDQANEDIPVVSISIDPHDLWDPVDGIHVLGNSYWPWYPYSGANFWEDWEKEAHIEFFEPGGEQGFEQSLGMKIFGGWSRAEPQKSFSFFARSVYGQGQINYSLFPDSDIDEYETFILRAHGQDNLLLRDGFHTSMASECDVVAQDYRPAAVYLNGEFWGIQNIREKVNEHFIESNYGIDPENLDIIQITPGSAIPELVHGSMEDYLDIRSYILANDMAIDSDYEYASSFFDVQNIIDYNIAQVFIMNWDWPANNNKIFKAKTPDGKWRHIMYDTDFGFARWEGQDWIIGFIGSYDTYNMLNHAIGDAVTFNNQFWSKDILRSFLDNNDFKNKFINTYCDRLNTIYKTENTVALADSISSIIDPYVNSHIERWSIFPSDGHTPDNMNQYNNYLNQLYSFANYRPENARQEIVESFGLDGASNSITVFTNDSDNGFVNVNTIKVDQQGWSGEYFPDIPITVHAIPKQGFEFSHWIGIDSDADIATIHLEENTTVVAYFSASGGSSSGDVVINEINYNSSDDLNSGDWVELYNNSEQDILIEGWKFFDENDDHVFEFSTGLSIASNEFLVICQDTSLFRLLHHDVNNYVGNTGFGLSGGGELIRLYNNENILVDSLTYDDSDPWPLGPDGEGFTLELINPGLDNSLPQSWSESLNLYGTPGSENSVYEVLDVSNEYFSQIPQKFSFYQNYPNPFNPMTQIKYEIPRDGYVSIAVYDLVGRLVKTLVNEKQSAGYYSINWDATNKQSLKVSAGMYIYTIQSGDFSKTKKMILLK